MKIIRQYRRGESFPTAFIVLVLFLAGYSPGQAGSFNSDFNSGLPTGASLLGSAKVDATNGVANSGVLRLTSATNSQQGVFLLADLDQGKLIEGFDATFKMRLGGGTGGYGLSFNFAPNLPNAAFGEEGGGSGISVSFASFDSGGGALCSGTPVACANA